MNEKEFKNYADNNIKSICSKISLEEINFLGDLIKAFNEVCEKYDKSQNNWNELKKLIDERIGDCRYVLANANVNYEKENMKKFMWLKEELQVLKSKAQELEQGKDE